MGFKKKKQKTILELKSELQMIENKAMIEIEQEYVNKDLVQELETKWNNIAHKIIKLEQKQIDLVKPYVNVVLVDFTHKQRLSA